MEQSKPETKTVSSKIILGFGLLVAAVVAWLMAHYLSNGVDYFCTFYPVTRSWLAGQTRLYDQASGSFGHLPWSVWLTIPFAVWPQLFGLSLLRVFSLASVTLAVVVFTRQGYRQAISLAFALFNLHTFDLLLRGQLDGYSVLGIVIGWLAVKRHKPWLLAAGLIAMMIKPTVTLPAALFLLWLAWKQWKVREVLAAMAPPSCVVVLSFIVYGFWPTRLQAVKAASPRLDIWLSTIWRAQEILSLSPVIPWLITAIVIGTSIWAWHKAGSLSNSDSTLARLMLVIATTFLVTPYALGYYYVVLLAIVLPVLIDWRLDLGLGIYALTFLPVLRHWVGPDNAWIDLLFVLVVYVGVILYILRKPKTDSTPDEIDPVPA
ncbi:MAG: hypothetical protein JXJ17_03275 [Anaerolineae bacterium]|nr:hypothetical protein [Anaerolineae bacterium]